MRGAYNHPNVLMKKKKWWLKNSVTNERNVKDRGGSNKRKHHRNLPTITQTALSIRIRQKLHISNHIRNFTQWKTRRQLFDFMSAHAISRHCYRIANCHASSTCAIHAFINDMYPFHSSAATAKSFVHSVLNRNLDCTRPLPKRNKCWLGLACRLVAGSLSKTGRILVSAPLLKAYNDSSRAASIVSLQNFCRRLSNIVPLYWTSFSQNRTTTDPYPKTGKQARWFHFTNLAIFTILITTDLFPWHKYLVKYLNMSFFRI